MSKNFNSFIDPKLVKEEDIKLIQDVTCEICNGLLDNPFLYCLSCNKSCCEKCIERNQPDSIDKCSGQNNTCHSKFQKNYKLIVREMQGIKLDCEFCKKNYNLFEYSDHRKNCLMIKCPICPDSIIKKDDYEKNKEKLNKEYLDEILELTKEKEYLNKQINNSDTLNKENLDKILELKKENDYLKEHINIPNTPKKSENETQSENFKSLNKKYISMKSGYKLLIEEHGKAKTKIKILESKVENITNLGSNSRNEQDAKKFKELTEENRIIINENKTLIISNTNLNEENHKITLENKELKQEKYRSDKERKVIGEENENLNKDLKVKQNQFEKVSNTNQELINLKNIYEENINILETELKKLLYILYTIHILYLCNHYI